MDRSGANFLRCVDMNQEAAGARRCPWQIPIGSEENFKGMVDLGRNEGPGFGDSDDKDARGKASR